MSDDQKSQEVFMTKQEAMRHFNIGKYRLQYLIEDGVIPTVKFGYRTVRIPVRQATESLLALAKVGES